jgi:hypothetical protein
LVDQTDGSHSAVPVLTLTTIHSPPGSQRATASPNGTVLSPTFNVAIDLDGGADGAPRPLARAANAAFRHGSAGEARCGLGGLNVPESVRTGSTAGRAGVELLPAAEAQEFIARVIELVGIEHIRILTARRSCRRR